MIAKNTKTLELLYNVNRVNLILDYDGCIADTHTPWINLANDIAGTSYTRKHWVDYDPKNCMPEIRDLMFKGYRDATTGEHQHLVVPSLYEKVRLMPGFVDAFEKMLDIPHTDIFVVTANPNAPGRTLEDFRREKITLLRREFEKAGKTSLLKKWVPEDRLCMIVEGDLRGKACTHFDILIEDSPKVLHQYKQVHPDGICVVMDNPWTRGDDVAGVDQHRIMSWNDASTVPMLNHLTQQARAMKKYRFEKDLYKSFCGTSVAISNPIQKRNFFSERS
ncbi:MAG: 5' nucleotidase, NT5C type [Verrucomicrobiota bacterium]